MKEILEQDNNGMNMTIQISSVHQNTFSTYQKVQSDAVVTETFPESEIKFAIENELKIKQNVILFELPNKAGTYQKIK